MTIHSFSFGAKLMSRNGLCLRTGRRRRTKKILFWVVKDSGEHMDKVIMGNLIQ